MVALFQNDQKIEDSDSKVYLVKLSFAVIH